MHHADHVCHMSHAVLVVLGRPVDHADHTHVDLADHVVPVDPVVLGRADRALCQTVDLAV